jgi:hypothetical protein
MSHTTKLALAAALVLGVASVAKANDKDADPVGGYRVGPLGQSFEGANPVFHPSMRGHSTESYGYQRNDNEHNTR